MRHYANSRIVALAVLIPAIAASNPTRSPEEEVRAIAKHLRPIPDSEWESIAGEKVSEKYEINSGDTLWDISQRLFGDPRYWPKIWALNNGAITNPHLILPGHSVVFMPGTGTSLPSVEVTETADDSGASKIPMTPGRSDEWRKLPPQSWESIQVTLPPQVDPLGFDRRSRILSTTSHSFELDEIVASDHLKSLGTITAAQTAANTIGLDEVVFVESSGALQVGDTFAITRNPTLFSTGEENSRVGYGYPIIGTVKLNSVRDHVFSGQVLSGKSPIERGMFLIPIPEKVPDPVPLATGPAPLEGTIFLDHSFSAFFTAQNKFAFVDLGSGDGIKQGMVFRMYEQKDPSNSKPLISHLAFSADFVVLQASERFSTVMVLYSVEPILEGSKVSLITDSVDLQRYQIVGGVKSKNFDMGEPDELDQLGISPSGLGEEEEKELKQLEKWKHNPEPSPSPEASVNPESSPPPEPSPVASPIPEPAPSALPPPEPSAAPSLPPPTAPGPATPPSETPPAAEPTPAVTPDLLPPPLPMPTPEGGPPTMPEELPPPSDFSEPTPSPQKS